ncbi:MAG: T9SS type A sorting domain-containing protein [Saprospiraceae bacterium]
MRSFLFIFCLLYPFVSFAQNENKKNDYTWQLGYNVSSVRFEHMDSSAVLDFNFSPAKTYLIPRIYRVDASHVSLCDDSGNFVIASNGCRIFNAQGGVVVGSENITPDSFAYWGNWCPPPETYPARYAFMMLPLPESDFRNSAINNIRYFHRPVVPETPLTFTVGKVFPEITGSDKQCESIYCTPPCRSDEQIYQAKQAISTAKAEFNTVYASYAQQPNGPNAASQKNSMTALQATMQGNTFDVLLHIIANEGSLADYRYWLGNLDAYETDLELAKSYLGAGEFSQSSSLLNAMPTKHALSGEKLTVFNDYRAVLDVMQVHLQNGGDKYNLPAASINTLKSYAENNGSARVRGQAKAMLVMYGIFYPPEEATEAGGRDAQGKSVPAADVFTLSPNPADQSVWVKFPNAANKYDLTAQVNLYSVHGRLLLQQKVRASEEGLNVPLTAQPEGCYFLQIRLSDGAFATLPLIIAH